MLRRNLALLTPYLLCLLLLGALSFRAPQLMTWVAIGDSITYLNDHPDQTGNRITKGYMTRVVEKLPYINFVNQGHNGWTAIRIAQQIDSLGLTKADIYSVFLGTNDWWHSKPLGRFSDYQQHTGTATVYGSFRVILDKLRRLNPQAHLLLITPMPRTDFVQINNPKNNAYGSYKPKEGQTLEAFAMAIDSIGHTEQIPVVDLYHLRGLRVEKLVKYKRLKDPATGHYVDYKYPAYTSIPFDPATDEYPYPPGAIARTYDGLHPSDKGYELITRALVKQIKAFRQAN